MKVTLLNDGKYYGLKKVTFPIVAEATRVVDIDNSGLVFIAGEELIRIGGSPSYFVIEENYSFYLGEECVVGEALC